MSTTDPIVEPSPSGPPPAPPAPVRRRRWPWVVIPVLVVVLALVIAGFAVTLPYYALAPGQAQAVDGLISLPAEKSHPVKSQILLTDVSLGQVRLIDIIPDWLDSNVQLVKTQDLLGDTPPSQFEQQSVLDMNDSKQDAQVAALRRLGYQVPEHDSGATIEAVEPGSPASHALSVGDAITAVDGVPTLTSDAVVAAVHAHQPGQTVTLTVSTGPGHSHQVPITLASQVENGKRVPLMGVVLQTDAQYQMPLNISINSEGIGGPSAGLAFSLGIVNGLTNGNITGGAKVAATGTIDANGAVGDVGGVAQKTVAVENAGATVFFVPPEELTVARAHADRGLRVLAVSTLNQALADLASMGGDTAGVPPPPPTPTPGG